MADRIHAEFTEKKGLLLREVLQPSEVALKISLPVKVDVECGKIRVLRQQVFGGRIACVGEKRVLVLVPSNVDEVFDKLRDLPRT